MEKNRKETAPGREINLEKEITQDQEALKDQEITQEKVLQDQKVSQKQDAAHEKEFLASVAAGDTIPYGLANDYMFHAVLQSSAEALQGLLSALLDIPESEILSCEVINPIILGDAITEKTKDLDCEVSTNTSSMDYSSYFGSGLSVRIKGNDIETLQKLAGEVADVMKDTKGTTDIDDGMEDSEPQLTISVDKKKAAKYGLTVAQVYQLVSAKMADSKTATTITTDIKDYKVYVQTEEQADTKLSDIKDMTFSYTNKNGKEKEIPLTKICEMKETSTLSTISRDAQTRYITVSCGVDEDHNVTLMSNTLQKAMDIK